MRRMLLIAVLLAFAASDTSASFTAPVELSAAPYGLGGTAATDAAGTTTVVITGANGTLLRERRRGGAWSAGTRLPGRPKGVAGPVVDAAGNGALAIAWRVDSPRAYSGIAVALRDPGGALSQPIAIAGSAAGGVRHPALAIDARGDALLAYNAGTRTSHLSDRGTVAVTYRRAGGAFAKPVIVDGGTAGAPKVALAPDGSGVVAWTRGGRVYGVVIAAGGRIGKAKALASAPGVSSLAAVAANGGAATVLWTARGSSQRRVSAVYSQRGGAFVRARTVASASVFRVGAQAAADDRGRMVAAWREEGVAGSPGAVSSSIVTAGGVVGRPLGPARVVVRRRTGIVTSPSVAMTGGRAVIAWGYGADRRRFGVQAAIGSPTAPGARETVASVSLTSVTSAPPVVDATIDAQGPATLVFTLPAERGTPPMLSQRLLAADGT
jgi:hypothetical protein